MENKKSNPEIPEWIVRDKDRTQFLDRFNLGLQGLNKSFSELIGMNDMELPKDPRSFSEDDVNKYFDERINEVSGTRILTHESKERVKKEWEDIRSKAIGCIRKIAQFCENYPDAELYLGFAN